MRHAQIVVRDLLLQSAGRLVVVAEAEQDVAIWNARRKWAAQVLAKLIVQVWEQNSTGVESVHRLKQNQTHAAVVVGGGVRGDGIALGHEIRDGGVMPIFERDAPALKLRLRDVRDRSIRIDRLADMQRTDERLGHH